MAFFIKSLNRRWSLYVVKDNKSAYAMHANSVMHIVGYVMGYFANGQIPVSPWALYLCTNGKKLMLGSEHFSSDGESPTPLLINQIENGVRSSKVASLLLYFSHYVPPHPNRISRCALPRHRAR